MKKINLASKNKKNLEWFEEGEEFFNKKYFEEWGEFITPERSIREVDFIEAALKLEKGDKILDLACGHGRHAIEFALRGYKISGQDINKLFLSILQNKAKNAGVEVETLRGDMRKILFKEKFDAIINMFTSFGYFEDVNDDQTVLNGVARSLKKGGFFVMDFLNKEQIIRNFKSKDWLEMADGTVVLLSRIFDFVTGINNEERIRISKNGKIEKAFSKIRMYTVSELANMLNKAGLELLELYGSYKGDPLTLDSNQVILTARKV